MAMATGACWVGHFRVEPGIFVSNHVFLCQPSVFVTNRALLCETSVIMGVINPKYWPYVFIIVGNRTFYTFYVGIRGNEFNWNLIERT